MKRLYAMGVPQAVFDFAAKNNIRPHLVTRVTSPEQIRGLRGSHIKLYILYGYDKTPFYMNILEIARVQQLTVEFVND